MPNAQKQCVKVNCSAQYDLSSVNWTVNPQNKTKQIISGITLSGDYLSQKIIKNMPRKG